MAKKLPYLDLYTGDWLKDPSLSLCEPATRGIWIDLLCAMHERDRCGVITGTPDQLARISRCSAVDFVQAVADLQTHQAAEVTQRGDKYTVINRRMKNDADRRKREAARQRRKREALSAHCHGDVALDNDLSLEEIEKRLLDLFDDFWAAYPPGRKTSKGKARESWMVAVQKEPAERIIAAAKHYATTPDGKGQFVKMPSTWLNQECWDDDRAAWDRIVESVDREKETAQRKRDEERAMAQRENQRRRQEQEQAYRGGNLAAELANRMKAKTEASE